MGAAHDLFAYRTMRAVERANPAPPRKPGRWARWRAWLDRTADRLLG